MCKNSTNRQRPRANVRHLNLIRASVTGSPKNSEPLSSASRAKIDFVLRELQSVPFGSKSLQRPSNGIEHSMAGRTPCSDLLMVTVELACAGLHLLPGSQRQKV